MSHCKQYANQYLVFTGLALTCAILCKELNQQQEGSDACLKIKQKEIESVGGSVIFSSTGGRCFYALREKEAEQVHQSGTCCY